MYRAVTRRLDTKLCPVRCSMCLNTTKPKSGKIVAIFPFYQSEPQSRHSLYLILSENLSHRAAEETRGFAKDLKSLFGFLRSFSSEKDLKPRGSDWRRSRPSAGGTGAKRPYWRRSSLGSVEEADFFVLLHGEGAEFGCVEVFGVHIDGADLAVIVGCE